MTEVIVHAADLAAMSLVLSVVAYLLFLIGVNRVVIRVAPKFALSQSELMLIYTMNATTVGICGIGGLQFLVSTLAAPQYFKTPDNHWDQWIHYLRPWAFPDKGAIPDFYTGRSSLFTAGHLAAWLPPIMVWSLFVFVLVATMYCIATVFRRQWVSKERLLFPLIAIPLEITQNGGDAPIFKNRLFWGGAGLAVFLEVLATLHYTISPGIPYVPIKPNETLFELNNYITTPPWNGIGNFELAIYPMVIGMAYLLSLDISFSVWFFYILQKLENISAVAFGFKDPGAPPAISRIPYPDQQCAGAFTGLAVVAIYYAWPHIKQAFAFAFASGGQRASSGYSDEHEPLPYKTAFVGMFGGAIFLIAFAYMLGISLLVSVIFVGLFLMWALTMTRIRAEAGLPWGVGPNQDVHDFIVNIPGSSQFSTQELTGIISLRWMDSDFRCLEMQQQMEAMKLADDGLGGKLLLNPRHMTRAIAAAMVVAVLAGWVSLLSIYYQYGAATAHADVWRTQIGNYTFEELQSWITTPTPVDTASLQWIGVGTVVTLALSAMRAAFAWWPLNPIGYAVSLAGGMDWIWFPIFLGWLFKRLILRYGGLKMYRNALPFFIGLVIGDYAISAVLALLTTVLQSFGIQTTGYRTFPI